MAGAVATQFRLAVNGNGARDGFRSRRRMAVAFLLRPFMAKTRFEAGS